MLALELALKLQCGIVNADSVQVYKDLVIGSAQPSKDDFKIAPHYLYGYMPAGSSLTAAAFCEDVQTVLNTKLNPQNPVILCGGSGFYIQALEKGMFDVPMTEEQKEKVEKTIEEWGWDRAYQELLARDPNVKIHANDHYRIGRALEILLVTGRKPTDIVAQSESAPLYGKKLIKLGIDIEKEKLRERITQRTHQMLASGWIEEVEKLIASGHKEWSALRSVGYNEVLQFLDGKLTHSEMIANIVIANMQLIKKQRTWFKRDENIQWYTPETASQGVESTLRAIRN